MGEVDVDLGALDVDSSLLLDLVDRLYHVLALAVPGCCFVLLRAVEARLGLWRVLEGLVLNQALFALVLVPAEALAAVVSAQLAALGLRVKEASCTAVFAATIVQPLIKAFGALETLELSRTVTAFAALVAVSAYHVLPVDVSLLQVTLRQALSVRFLESQLTFLTL